MSVLGEGHKKISMLRTKVAFTLYAGVMVLVVMLSKMSTLENVDLFSMDCAIGATGMFAACIYRTIAIDRKISYDKEIKLIDNITGILTAVFCMHNHMLYGDIVFELSLRNVGLLFSLSGIFTVAASLYSKLTMSCVDAISEDVKELFDDF